MGERSGQVLCECSTSSDILNRKIELFASCTVSWSQDQKKHIKLFSQCDEHLFFSIPGVRNHWPHVMRMLSVTNFQNGGQAKEGNKKNKAILQWILNIHPR